MKTVNRSVQGLTLKVPMCDANTPIFVVAIQNALNEGCSVSEATSRSWAASRKELQVAKTANGGARVIVVGMAYGEIKGSFIVDNAWVRNGLKQAGQMKERDRLYFSWKSELLGRHAITLDGHAIAPRRAIALCK